MRRVPAAMAVWLVAVWLFAGPVFANPSGPVIRHGDIRISGSGANLEIHQATSHGIIDWNSFSIQEGGVTRFLQPGASAATLNRVTGASLSRIDGSLLANGRVLLLNPNGILIGRNGVVDTGGFTASTLDLSNADFLAGGDLRFQGNSTAGIVNLGSINAVDGDIFLIAASVLNEGSLRARNGTVGLAAGNDVLIAESGSERVFVRGAGTAAEDSGVINRGTVSANAAELKSYGGNIYGMAVQNEGRVAATAVRREGGQIFLQAGGGGSVRTSGSLTAKKEEGGGNVVVESGPGGATEVDGVIDAGSSGGTGGVVVILGSTIDLFEDSVILADGGSDGGRIFVGGGKRGLDPDFHNATNVTVVGGATLSANAGALGNGGEIIVFAENRLDFSGALSATGGTVSGDGGFAELSGKNEILVPDLTSRVALTASNGRGGTLLFDPNDIEIVTGEGEGIGTGFPAGLNEIVAGDIISFLGTGTNLVIETNGTGGSGDILVRTGVELEWNGDAGLTFLADRDFLLERGAAIRALDGGSVTIDATRAVKLGADISEETTPGGGIFTNTGDITISGHVGGTLTGEFAGVELLEGTITSVGGDIGITARGGSDGGAGFAMSGASSQVGGPGMSGDISISVDTIELAEGTLQSGGDLLIRPLDMDSNINIGAGALEEGLHLDATEIGRFVDGFSSITIGNEEFGNGVFRIGAVTFTDPVSLYMPYFAGEFFITGDLIGADDASIFIDGAGPLETATTYLTANIFTEGNAITISDNVVLGGEVTIDATGGGSFAAGADIEIDGTVRGQGEVPSFRVDAGTDGQIFFRDAVGRDDEVGAISLAARSMEIDFAIAAAGDLTIQTVEGLRVGPYSPLTAGGDILLEANPGEFPVSGDFTGVEIDSLVEADAGLVTIRGVGGDGEGNSGVVLKSLSNIVGGTGVMIEGGAQFYGDTGLLAEGSIHSSGGSVELGTSGGDLRVGGSVSAYDRIRLFGDEVEDSNLFVEGYLDPYRLEVNGGGGTNLLDFSAYTGYGLSLGADQLTGISELIGPGSFYDTFAGAQDSPAEFTITGVDTLTYEEGEEKQIAVSGFGIIRGGLHDDVFTIDTGESGVFSGELDGGAGEDRFVFLSGGVESVYGGEEDSPRGDVLDYSGILEDVFVDFERRESSGIGFFSGIETFSGGGGSNTILGSEADDEIFIAGNGAGSITVPGMDSPYDYEMEYEYYPGEYEGMSGGAFFFEQFATVSGAGGGDIFTVDLPVGESFAGALHGDAGDDTFVLLPGGGVASIDGGIGTDTLDFNSFTRPVAVDIGGRSATQVSGFQSIESVVGGSARDTLNGTAANDQFFVDRDGGGFLNSGRFESFEILLGQGGADRFVFQNQATVARFDGGGGIDTFVLDDSSLGGTNVYTISGNSVSRNPSHFFSGMEFLHLLLGPGNDTVITDDNGLIQILNGGGGTDTIDFGTTPVSGRTPFLFGGTQVFESGFENFLLVRDESSNPENINPSLPGNGGGVGGGALIDQFSGTGGVGQALGNAFGAIAGNALLAGQASVIQVDGGEYRLQAPASLDGFFTQPPPAIVELLNQNLEVDAWSELADAIDFGGATILVLSDGPYSISLEGVPPDGILPLLAESLLADPARELLEALELAFVIPVTSLDGAVSILTIPVVIEPAILQQLLGNLNEAAEAELTAALGD